MRNHDEDLDGYLARRQDYLDGNAKGMPGPSLGVAVRLAQQGIDLLRSPKASDGSGGALGEATALERGNSVGIRDQAKDLAEMNGLQTATTNTDN